MTTSASRTFPGVNRRNSKVRESWKTLATAAPSPRLPQITTGVPSPMKVSPQITHRAVRAGSQWSTVTQFSFISDGISSDSSSGRRISFESFESYTSEDSSTAPILPLASRPSEDTFRAYLTPPETPPEVSRRHGYVLESGSHDNPCCVPESGAHDDPCCVPESAHDKPCCVPESGAHDDPLYPIQPTTNPVVCLNQAPMTTPAVYPSQPTTNPTVCPSQAPMTTPAVYPIQPTTNPTVCPSQ
ncbi:hypothetical protein Hamer_G017475 [Homarus americanus]|uniref:Uncharacterized protein n=1 Tax=Homarus americanus TaxID=6706 RepID=A0A8J5JPK6_HOMAM|nr:hypothetical protein Hamer_G017475 [Homarus americanus]